MKKTFFALLLITLIMLFSNCKKEEQVTKLPIIAELPIIYGGCNLKNGETTIVNNLNDLKKVLIEETINQIPEIKNIDFNKHSILLGCGTFTRGIDNLQHFFYKTGNDSRLYKIKILYNLSLPAGNFYYGIVVNAINSKETVRFEISTLNN